MPLICELCKSLSRPYKGHLAGKKCPNNHIKIKCTKFCNFNKHLEVQIKVENITFFKCKFINNNLINLIINNLADRMVSGEIKYLWNEGIIPPLF